MGVDIIRFEGYRLTESLNCFFLLTLFTVDDTAGVVCFRLGKVRMLCRF